MQRSTKKPKLSNNSNNTSKATHNAAKKLVGMQKQVVERVVRAVMLAAVKSKGNMQLFKLALESVHGSQLSQTYFLSKSDLYKGHYEFTMHPMPGFPYFLIQGTYTPPGPSNVFWLGLQVDIGGSIRPDPAAAFIEVRQKKGGRVEVELHRVGFPRDWLLNIKPHKNQKNGPKAPSLVNAIPQHVLQTHVMPRLPYANLKRFAQTSTASHNAAKNQLAAHQKKAVESLVQYLLVNAMSHMGDATGFAYIVRDFVTFLKEKTYHQNSDSYRFSITSLPGEPYYEMQGEYNATRPGSRKTGFSLYLTVSVNGYGTALADIWLYQKKKKSEPTLEITRKGAFPQSWLDHHFVDRVKNKLGKIAELLN